MRKLRRKRNIATGRIKRMDLKQAKKQALAYREINLNATYMFYLRKHTSIFQNEIYANILKDSKKEEETILIISDF